MLVSRLLAEVAIEDSKYRAGIRRVESENKRLEQSVDKAAKSTDDLTRSLDRTGAFTDRLRAHFTRITPTLTSLQAGFSKLGHATTQVGSHFVSLGAHLSTLAGKFTMIGGLAGGLTAALGAAGIGGALTALAKRGIDVNLSLAKSEATFRQLFKSADTAREFMVALKKEAATSAAEFVDLARFSEGLAVFGFEAREVIPLLRTLGDVAMGDAEKMARLVRAFGQIKALGKLSGEEANQLVEAGVPVREIMGMPMGQNFGDMDIPAGQAIAQLQAGLNQRFGGRQATAANEFPVRVSNMKDALNTITAGGTKQLLLVMTESAGKLLAMLNRIADSGVGAQILQTLFIPFEAVARAIGQIADNGEQVIQWIQSVVTQERLTTWLSYTLSLITTVAQSFLRFFGIDLPNLMNPQNIDQWFLAFDKGIQNVVHAVFGAGRVLDVVFTKVLPSALEDAKDVFSDLGDHIANIFNIVGAHINSVMAGITAQFFRLAADVGMFFGQEEWVSKNVVPRLSAALQDKSKNEQRRDAFLGQFQPGGAGFNARQAREAGKLARDPNRGRSIFDRIGRAYQGLEGDVGPEQRFVSDFGNNYRGFKGFFDNGLQFPGMGGGGIGSSGAGFPGAPQLYNPNGGGGGTVVTMQNEFVFVTESPEQAAARVQRILEDLARQGSGGPMVP